MKLFQNKFRMLRQPKYMPTCRFHTLEQQFSVSRKSPKITIFQKIQHFQKCETFVLEHLLTFSLLKLCRKTYNINYVNIPFGKKLLQSGSKSYVNNFLQLEEENPSNIIEIHNRPNYLEYFIKKSLVKIVLYFHNDPLTMIGSKSKNQRINLFSRSYKIIFNSEWSKNRFLNGLDKIFYKSEKLIVIYQSTNKVKVNLNKKKNWIIFVGKLNRAKGYDLFGKAVLKILNKFPN